MPAPPASADICVENTDEKPEMFVSAYWDPFSMTRTSGLKMHRTRDLPVRQTKCIGSNRNAQGGAAKEKT
jgi:hypothetical protein